MIHFDLLRQVLQASSPSEFSPTDCSTRSSSTPNRDHPLWFTTKIRTEIIFRKPLSPCQSDSLTSFSLLENLQFLSAWSSPVNYRQRFSHFEPLMGSRFIEKFTLNDNFALKCPTSPASRPSLKAFNLQTRSGWCAQWFCRIVLIDKKLFWTRSKSPVRIIVKILVFLLPVRDRKTFKSSHLKSSTLRPSSVNHLKSVKKNLPRKTANNGTQKQTRTGFESREQGERFNRPVNAKLVGTC